MAVHQPGDSIAHFKNIFENDGPHPGVAGLDGCLDGINPTGAALQMGSCMNVNIDCSSEEFIRQFKRSVVCKFHDECPLLYSILELLSTFMPQGLEKTGRQC
jgi:hypothetical protein